MGDEPTGALDSKTGAQFINILRSLHRQGTTIVLITHDNGIAAKGEQAQVIWIYGSAGTGKTSLSKEYARKKQRPFYITDASRDVFQGYKVEHTLLLDELRYDAIPYADLLRIFDPFSLDAPQVQAPSRYYDKALARCLLPDIQAYFESEDGQREFAEWQKKQKRHSEQQEERASSIFG